MKVLLEVWRLLTPAERGRLIRLQAVSLLMAASTVGGLAAVLPFFKLLVDEHAFDDSPLLHMVMSAASSAGASDPLYVIGALFAAVVCIGSTINFFGSVAMSRFALDIGRSFNSALFRLYLGCEYREHAATSNVLLSTRLIHEAGRVASSVIQGGLALITNLATVIVICVSIVLTNSPLTSLSMVVLAAGYVLIYAAARRRLQANGQQESEMILERGKIVDGAFGAIKDVIVSGKQAFFVEKFTHAYDRLVRSTTETATIAQIPRFAFECLTVITLLAAALYLRATRGAGADFPQLTFLAFAIYRLLPAIQQIFYSAVRIRADSPAFSSVAADVRRAQHLKRVVKPDEAPRLHLAREVAFVDVSFRYGTNDSLVLERVSARLPAHSLIGITGPNGTGKTTLIDILAGLLRPTSGELRIDGVAIDDDNLDAWRANIAYVPERVVLVDGTFAENIAFGEPELDLSRIERAARLAGADEVVARHPKGYQATVGQLGKNLSNGQRQRIALARALYRNAMVLILDEATAALDVHSEAATLDTLRRLSAERTIFIVSHQARTLSRCDVVLELTRETGATLHPARARFTSRAESPTGDVA